MMTSCVSRMEVEEEKMGGWMSGDAISSFQAVDAHGRIWAEVGPYCGCRGGDNLHDKTSDRRGGEGLIPAGGSGSGSVEED